MFFEVKINYYISKLYSPIFKFNEDIDLVCLEMRLE